MIGPHDAPYCKSFAASSASESVETFTLSDAIAVQTHTQNTQYCIPYCNTLKNQPPGTLEQKFTDKAWTRITLCCKYIAAIDVCVHRRLAGRTYATAMACRLCNYLLRRPTRTGTRYRVHRISKD